MNKPQTQNIRVGCLVWYFAPRIIPGTSHKLRSFWAGPFRVSKLIALSQAEIKPVYYPGEEKLVSLDMLKLYRGEDVVRQEPEDVDPDGWVDDGELTELQEIPLRGRERLYVETVPGPRSPVIPAESTIDVQVIPEDPEEMAVREGINERIQAEMHHENKETAARAKEMLEIPPEWNKVPDLMMEEGDILPEDTRPDKRKRDEISQGWRKRRKEEDIRAEKREHSPAVSWRIQNPEGFYSKDWEEDKQEEDE